MSTPSLSVIIPTYNRSGFVRTCLLALRESGVADLEVIIVDDGGTDDTREVAAAIEPRALYLRQKNQGPAAARNLGFERSTGRYVGFLDCDDAWLPAQPAAGLDWLDLHPEVDVLFAEARMGNAVDGYRSWIESSGQARFFDLPHQADAGSRILERTALLERMLVRNCVFLGSTLVRREALQRSGLFDPELCGAADWNLWLRLAAQATFAFRPEPLAIYTKHDGGMSNDDDGMSREFGEALLRLTNQVELTPAARAIRDRQLRHHLFGYAYRAYDRGDYREARRRFGRLIRICGGDSRSLAFLAVCSAPGPLIRGTRGVIQRLRGTQSEAVVSAAPVARAVLR